MSSASSVVSRGSGTSIDTSSPGADDVGALGRARRRRGPRPASISFWIRERERSEQVGDEKEVEARSGGRGSDPEPPLHGNA